MSNNREALVKELYRTLHQTLSYFDQPEAALNRSYAPGKWTLRELLVHLADCEAVYLERLRRLVAEEKPLLAGFDEARWAKELNYKQRDLQLAKAQYEVARRSIIELARTTPESMDARTGTHTEAGTRSFGQVLRGNAEHNAHHLEQIAACAEGREWKKK